MRMISARKMTMVIAMGLGAMSSGCIIGGRAPLEGDVALLWGIEGGYTCREAGVADVLVSIRGQDTSDAFEVVMPCVEGGGTFTDFREGNYTVHLEGLDLYGTVWYAHTQNVYVDGGATADLGRVMLYRVGGPLVTTGSLQLDWSFLYPSDSPTLDCAYAGVDYVHIGITDRYGALVFDESVRCIDGPAVIDYFDPGTYFVDLDGLGAYHGRSVLLFQAPTIEVFVEEDHLTDVGVVPLDRRLEQFGDFRIEWSFGGNNSCAAVGVSEVTVSIIRLAGDVLDDQFTVSCADEPQLRTTFVPGDYDVVVEANDDLGGYWTGWVGVDLGPGTMADILVQTELSP